MDRWYASGGANRRILGGHESGIGERRAGDDLGGYENEGMKSKKPKQAS